MAVDVLTDLEALKHRRLADSYRLGSCTAIVERGEFCGRPNVRTSGQGHTCVSEHACQACGREPSAAGPRCKMCPAYGEDHGE